MNVMFMGTPEFAIPCLEALCDSFTVTAVVTQPDKPKGRGYVLTPPPVKVYAKSRNIQVFQPETLKNEAFLDTLKMLQPDVIVVVAYGKILPSYILNYPKYGCINVHGSLLPKYRGAAPMQRVLIDGELETGVTTMYMAEGLDTGDMLEKHICPIEENDNFESIHDKLSLLGSKAIISTLKALEKGELVPKKQDDSLSSYAQKIEKSDCIVNFDSDVNTVHNQIRGLSPFPLAFAYLNGRMIKFISSEIVKQKKSSASCGTVVGIENKRLEIACKNGIIAITALLPEGKKRMTADDFIRGRGVALGDIFVPDKDGK